MNQRIERDGHVLEIRRERIDVTTALPQSDRKWSFIDAAGHAHHYGTEQEPYPTLARRSSEPYWCEDCEDEHVDKWYECPLCGEKITPGSYVDTSSRSIPGLASATLDGEPITQEQAEAFIAEGREARM